MPSLQVFKNLM